LHTQFGDSHSRYIIVGIENNNWSCVTCDPDQAFFKGHLSSICWGIAYLCTNPHHYNVRLSSYMVGAHQNLNRSHNLTTPLSEIIRHMLASTCNNQPTYQIWTLYLHLLWKCKRRYKI